MAWNGKVSEGVDLVTTSHILHRPLQLSIFSKNLVDLGVLVGMYLGVFAVAATKGSHGVFLERACGDIR
jgi:hypothetical protein